MTLTLFSPHQALCHGANSWSVENSRGQAKEKKNGEGKSRMCKNLKLTAQRVSQEIFD